jgi:hypothetical protein
MPQHGTSPGRDPLSTGYDDWARGWLEQLEADPWHWHARHVEGPDRGRHGRWDLTDTEQAVQRSLYWCLSHAASSGAKIRPAWSLTVGWSSSTARPTRTTRRRLLCARVVPRSAGRAFYLEP